MTPKPKKRKARRYRSPVKKLGRELDDLVRQVIRRRDKFCVCCGSRENLQVGHLIKRGRKRTRWSLLNCNAQCPGCNLKHNYYPERYTEWFITKYGVPVYQALISEAGTIWKPTEGELNAIKEDLLTTIRKLQ